MYKEQTEKVIKERLLQKMEVPLNKSEGSDLSNISAGFALGLSEGYSALDAFIELIMGDALDESLIPYAESFGIFHKKGEKARGTATIIGKIGTVIKSGTLMKTTSELVYKTEEAVTLEMESVQVALVAEHVGAHYNGQPVALKLIIDQPSVLNIVADAFSGGVDVESLESLSQRLKDHLRRPSSSGNINDYVNWATSVTGVSKCKVMPLWNGGGTVKCVVYGELGEPVSDATLEEVQTLINTLRPITAEVTVATVTNKLANLRIQGLKFASGFSEIKVKESILKNLNDYLKSVEPGETLIHKKILATVVSIEGVADVSQILINDKTENITTTDEEKIAIGEVFYEA